MSPILSCRPVEIEKGLPAGEAPVTFFLDIDGVLNFDALVDHARPHGHVLFNPLTHLDRVLVSRLYDSVERWNAEVVITSTWREDYNLPSLRAFLQAKGFMDTDRIVGVTPILRNVSRHVEIMTYLADKGKRRPRALAVIDDNPQAVNGVLLPFFVQCNPADGFSHLTSKTLDMTLRSFLSPPPHLTHPRWVSSTVLPPTGIASDLLFTFKKLVQYPPLPLWIQ